MRKSRMDRSKNNKPIIIGSIVSVVLLVLIASVYIFKDELFSSKSENVTTNLVETQGKVDEEAAENQEQPDTAQQDEQPEQMIEVDAAGYAVVSTPVA